MKFGQIIVDHMINIFNLFLALLSRLEISVRPFYNFYKIAKQCDLLVFSRLFLLFWIVSVHTFKRVKNQHLIKIIF